ncbi:hypothetical protein ACFLS7_03450 [Bacteroidota bacterium]
MRFSFLVIVLIAGAVNSSFGQWQQCNGTANLNFQSLITNGIYNFAGGETGVYLSTDAAENYTSSNQGNDSVGPTRGFAKDDTYVYTCTSQGVFRSGDNGNTWEQKSDGITNPLTSGMIHANSMLFVVGTKGVFKSADHGDTWSGGGLSSVDVRCITAIQDTLYVGTDGKGVFKSTDWGATWKAVNNSLFSTKVRAIQSKGNTLFAGGQPATGLFRSTDFGATWKLLAGGLPSDAYRGFACNDELIVAGTFGGGVYYSLDNGDTWRAINEGLTDLTIFDLALNDGYIVAATNTQGVFRFPLSAIK